MMRIVANLVWIFANLRESHRESAANPRESAANLRESAANLCEAGGGGDGLEIWVVVCW